MIKLIIALMYAMVLGNADTVEVVECNATAWEIENYSRMGWDNVCEWVEAMEKNKIAENGGLN